MGTDGGKLRQLTDGWNTFIPPIQHPITGQYLVCLFNTEDWFVLPVDAEQVGRDEVTPMPKVSDQTGEWMRPEVFSADGSQVVGTVFGARKTTSEPPIPIGLGIFTFETSEYQLHLLTYPENYWNTPATLTPNGSHAIIGDRTQIRAVNLETGKVIPVLNFQTISGQCCTVTTDGYLYYIATRDERNIWLSEIDDVPMQTTDN